MRGYSAGTSSNDDAAKTTATLGRPARRADAASASISPRTVTAGGGASNFAVAAASYIAFSRSSGTSPTRIGPATPLSSFTLGLIPANASKPGILAGVAAIIAQAGISIRQVIMDDPEIVDDPHGFIVTEAPVPERLLPQIKQVDGVKSVVLH